MDKRSSLFYTTVVDEEKPFYDLCRQLGLGSIEDEFVPNRVVHPELSREVVVKVDAGYAHTIALTGSVLFGSDHYQR